MELDIMKRYKTAEQSILSSRPKRMLLNEGKISFGVEYLDRCLNGILPSDLILIGAMPGVGKTELSISIAMSAAQQGKRVTMFALEAEEDEVTERILYRMVAEKYWNDPEFSLSRRVRHLDYPEWLEGQFDNILLETEKACEKEYLEKYKTLLVRYKSGDFTVKDLSKEIHLVSATSDMIIIDHLHYIDLDAEVHENKAMSDLIKQLRDLSLVIKKPIIIISHLRKQDERMNKIIPSLQDFRGTGDIGGVVTKAIIIAHSREHQKECAKGDYATFIHAAKYRRAGGRTYLVGLCVFSSRKQCYEKQFRLGKLQRKGNNLAWDELEPEMIPHWVNKENIKIVTKEKKVEQQDLGF